MIAYTCHPKCFSSFTTPTGLLLLTMYSIRIYTFFSPPEKSYRDEQKENGEISPHFTRPSIPTSSSSSSDNPSSHMLFLSPKFYTWNEMKERNFPFHFFNVKQRALSEECKDFGGKTEIKDFILLDWIVKFNTSKSNFTKFIQISFTLLRFTQERMLGPFYGTSRDYLLGFDSRIFKCFQVDLNYFFSLNVQFSS